MRDFALLTGDLHITRTGDASCCQGNRETLRPLAPCPTIPTMAWFADLTPYTYHPGAHDPPHLNVGWLSAGKPFPTGAVPAGFLARLAELARDAPTNILRGLHECELCPGAPAGTGELRVQGTDGIWYAAPVLIHHYVEVHHYRPPQGFIDAVMCMERPFARKERGEADQHRKDEWLLKALTDDEYGLS